MRISGDSEVAQEPNEDPTTGIGALEEETVADIEGSERTKKFFGEQGLDCFGDSGWKGGSLDGEEGTVERGGELSTEG